MYRISPPTITMIYRQDATKRPQLVYKFTHRSKISIFARQGRLVAPIHTKLGT